MTPKSKLGLAPNRFFMAIPFIRCVCRKLLLFIVELYVHIFSILRVRGEGGSQSQSKLSNTPKASALVKLTKQHVLSHLLDLYKQKCKNNCVVASVFFNVCMFHLEKCDSVVLMAHFLLYLYRPLREWLSRLKGESTDSDEDFANNGSTPSKPSDNAR